MFPHWNYTSEYPQAVEVLGWIGLGLSKGTPTYPGYSIPQASRNPQMKGIPKHKLLVGGLGYVPGVYWKVLRGWGLVGLGHLPTWIKRESVDTHFKSGTQVDINISTYYAKNHQILVLVFVLTNP